MTGIAGRAEMTILLFQTLLVFITLCGCGMAEGEGYLTIDEVQAAASEEFDDNQELDYSARQNPDYFQGDIRFDSDGSFASAGLTTVDSADLRQTPWPNGKVYYSLDRRMDTIERKQFGLALAELCRKTCVEWLPRKEMAPGQKAYTKVTKTESGGCWVNKVGHSGEVVKMFLDKTECFKGNHILHEMVHIVGFYHEQSRSDRDEYVEIIWQNIDQRHQSQFKKYDTTHFGEPYDYKSVMHYGPFAFSNNSKPTIEPLKGAKISPGTRPGHFLSDGDARSINKMYKCKMTGCPYYGIKGNPLPTTEPPPPTSTEEPPPPTSTEEPPPTPTSTTEPPACTKDDKKTNCAMFARNRFCEVSGPQGDFVRSRCCVSCKNNQTK